MTARAAILLAAIVAAPLGAGGLELTVIHTNDIHGWIAPRAAYWHAADPDREIGGAAALAAFYRSQPGAKLLVDAGDWFQGTPEGTISRGQALVDVINGLPYDAVVVGNHDFDLGQERLKELVGAIKIPVLGANVYSLKEKRRVPYLRPWVIKEVDGVKIGLFGLTTSNIPNLVFPELIAGLEFRREIDEAKEAVAALKKNGATVIIALTHIGFEKPDEPPYEGDKALAREVAGIDLIVGGHTHTALRHAYREATHETLIVQAGLYLTAAGKVTLTIDDETGRVVSSTAALVDLWVDQWGQDPRLEAIVAAQERAVSAAFDVVIATAQETLTRRFNRESAMGNWVTDCMRRWAAADLALQNGGGIRAELKQGPVTLRDIFNVMPFENYMVKLQMSGALVRETLEHGTGGVKALMQISGANVIYNPKERAGRRLREILIGGKPLDPDATYDVVTIDFLVKRGEGYNTFAKAARREFTRTSAREVLNSCARESRLITTPQGGRMRPWRQE